MAYIVKPHPSCPPQLVGGVLGTGKLHNKLVGDLLYRFQFTWEEGGGVSSDLRARQGIHVFLGHLPSRVDPVPGLERLTPLMFDCDRMVHLLHLFFYIPVGPYSTDWRLLALAGELPLEGLTPMTEIPAKAFAVQGLLKLRIMGRPSSTYGGISLP